MIGVMTLIVATATLLFVMHDEIRRRRQGPAVILDVDSVGTHTKDGEVLHIWRVTNSGTRNAKIFAIKPVGCQQVTTAEWPSIKMIAHGESRKFLVRSDDFENAWIVFAFHHSQDRRWAHAQWWAPEGGPDIIKERGTQIRQLLRDSRPWRRWRNKTKPVGPGGVIRTSLRTGSRSRREDVQTTFSIAGTLEDDD